MTQMIVNTPEDFIRWHQLHAMKLLEHNELLSETYWDDGRRANWVFGMPRSSTYLVEVFAACSGTLIVHGDWKLQRFGYYSNNSDAWNRLLWIADSPYLDYVAEKASIGSRHPRGGMAFDGRVAAYQIRQRAKELREDGRADIAQMLYRGAKLIEDEGDEQERLLDYFNDCGNWDHCRDAGEVVDPNVIYTHMALNRLAALLRERHGYEGPPACRPVPKAAE